MVMALGLKQKKTKLLNLSSETLQMLLLTSSCQHCFEHVSMLTLTYSLKHHSTLHRFSELLAWLQTHSLVHLYLLNIGM